MELGLKGKWGLICAGSKGLGRACAESLAEEGVNVVIAARGHEALTDVASHIRSISDVEVRTVATDITTQSGREETLSACPSLDILV
ncbi:MAG: SDR family NAD(P)-dependent oxidoreductase, partial [Burkholderiales bacterium]|nr:SDR family NAD(P)-dependent oxidoreductase [Burkholderiales bacterium]